EITSYEPCSQRRCVRDADAFGIEERFGEYLYIVRRNPDRAKSGIDFGRGEVVRLNSFQRRNILNVAWLRESRGARGSEFGANVAGEILVVSFPLLRFRIVKDETFQFRQKLLRATTNQCFHVLQIDAAFLVEGEHEGIGC